MNATSKPVDLLLVEDSQEDIFFFRRSLAKCGIEATLHVADDGRQAVEMLRGQQNQLWRPAVVFLDLKLPLLSGFDVLRWVGEQHFSPPLRIIVLSGSPHEKDRLLATELGAADYLVKPITIESLRSELSRAAARE